MKSISSALDTHLGSETTSLVTCWRVQQVYGGSPIIALGFTDHDKDLLIGGLNYVSTVGYNQTDVITTGDLAVDNLDVVGVLTSPSITEDDLRAGLWDYAAFSIFMVNWADLTQGIMYQRVGNLGEVTVGRDTFSAELRGLMQRYTTSIGEKTSPGCRADLGDSRCGVDLVGGSPSFTVTGTIDSIDATEIIISDAARTEPSPLVGESGYFEYGVITITSGANAGLRREVKAYALGVITIHLPFPYPIIAGTTYSMHAGCDKLITTCINKFSNVVNFRGEPYLVGRDKLAQVGRHSS